VDVEDPPEVIDVSDASLDIDIFVQTLDEDIYESPAARQAAKTAAIKTHSAKFSELNSGALTGDWVLARYGGQKKFCFGEIEEIHDDSKGKPLAFDILFDVDTVPEEDNKRSGGKRRKRAA